MIKLFVVLAVAFFVFSSLFSSKANAQSSTATGSDEISLYLGEHLPSQIEGVTEILPVFGGRYGIQTLRAGVAELGLFNVHAQGVDFSTFEASLRGSANMSPGTEGLYYAGLDFNYWRPADQEDRKSQLGFHVGAGAMLQVTDTVWIRGDLKFMGGPGSNLLLLFGVLFK